MVTLADITAPKCVFCDYTSQSSRLIEETANFYAMPTIGQISDGGHIMVIPKHHYSCLGAMGDAAFDEFEDLAAKMKAAVTEVYGRPLSFEHGILGQSVPHAHLQMLPLDVDLSRRIGADFKLKVPLSSIRELQQIQKARGVYLFYENQHGEKTAYLVDHFPQYLRIVAAEVAGMPQRGNWKEWRSLPERAELDDRLIDETVKKLRMARRG